MANKWFGTLAGFFSSPSPHRRIALAYLLCLCTTGCVSRLHKQSAALVNATTPVVQDASSAYVNARKIHDLRVDYDAVAQFDSKDPVYKPGDIVPLLTDKDIRVRLAVLAAFQSYAQQLSAITQGTDSPDLDGAAKSVGQNLRSLGNDLAPSIEGALNVGATPAVAASSTSSASTTASPAISTTAQNGIATAANALAQFLVAQHIRKELPGIIQNMQPHVSALCELMEKDLDTLHDAETKDYDYIMQQQTLFIRTSQLDPQQRRDQIIKLPAMVRQKRDTDQQIADLKADIAHLAEIHRALAEEAKGSQPESLQDKLADLESAGESLGKFYSSLSAPTAAAGGKP